jgi:Cdc6-like AAA superfamily ATPase
VADDSTMNERLRKTFDASIVFTPSAPINSQALFAGRSRQVNQVIDAVNQAGQHAIIFGERGVGKTSLANVLSSFLESLGRKVFAPRVNCDSSDTFSSIWKKLFTRTPLPGALQKPGFTTAGASEFAASDRLQTTYLPDDVVRLLHELGSRTVMVVIIDEFDRLTDTNSRRLFADTIKALSDHAVPATIVLVGVADTVDQLIDEHHSISRALVQIRMPRMSTSELYVIIDNGLARLEMTIGDDAKHHIAVLSQGLPHYTHLLALHASRNTLEGGETLIRMEDVATAIKRAVDEAQETIQSAYHKAVSSPRTDNLYAEVLLGCALAVKDDRGSFSAVKLRESLRKITGKSYDIPSFAQHLKNFCDESRGPILQRTGTRRRYRFRFADPLMQPYVIMRGFSDGRITPAALPPEDVRRRS